MTGKHHASDKVKQNGYLFMISGKKFEFRIQQFAAYPIFVQLTFKH